MAPRIRLLRVGADGGSKAAVAEGVVGGGADCGAGRIAYTRADAGGAVQLLVRDGDGAERELERVGPGRPIVYPRCDAAGERVGYTIVEGGGFSTHLRSDIYLVGLDGRGKRRLTDDSLCNANVTFHPDGRRVVFSSARGGHTNLWELRLD